jgi:glycosyltransferase involved in cell wall biosynthesis
VIWVPHFALHWKQVAGSRGVRFSPAPKVLTIHDLNIANYPEDWPPPAPELFEELKSFSRTCEAVITHSHFQESEILRYLKLPEEKVHVTPCPPLIDPEELTAPQTSDSVPDLLRRFKIVKPFVFFPGSTGYTHKNHIRLLLAWAAVRDRLRSECPLLVCTSKGQFWPSLKALIEALRLEDLVVFTDRVQTGELAALYHSSTFMIMPTLYEGGGSGPISEALIVGTPVLCSRIPPIEEQLEAFGCTATMFNPRSVDDIVDKILFMLAGTASSREQAKINRDQMLRRNDELWQTWTEVYCRRLESAAKAA